MEKIKKWAMLACAICLCAVMAGIFLRLFTLIIMHPRQEGIKRTLINWKEKYPFDESDNNFAPMHESKRIYRDLLKKVNYIKSNTNDWTSKHIYGYIESVELANKYKQLLNWNISRVGDENGVVEIEDNQLTGFIPRVDVMKITKSLIDFSHYCKENGVELVYIATPNKISPQDKKYNEKLDFYNRNMDDFIHELKKSNIRYIDIRDYSQGELMQRNLFYKTDHHWLAETGLWVSLIITRYMKTENLLYGDENLLNPENFNKEIYREWFLGSYGRQITLAKAKPEDFSLLYPKFNTDFLFRIPNLAIERRGDFSIMYNMNAITPRDYYNKSPHDAYSFGRKPLISIDNFYAENQSRILLIRDSFANTVIPFLALECRHLDAIDPKQFTGSIKSFISLNRPDIVIILYSGAKLESEIDYASHQDYFDFR